MAIHRTPDSTGFADGATRSSAALAAAATALGDRRLRHPPTKHKPRGGKPVSLRDVARQAKVSVATVSMVLNDNPRLKIDCYAVRVEGDEVQVEIP